MQIEERKSTTMERRNVDRIRQYTRQYNQENADRIREHRLTSETARCNDGCIDILHSNDFISYRYKNKYDCPVYESVIHVLSTTFALTDDALKLKRKNIIIFIQQK